MSPILTACFRMSCFRMSCFLSYNNKKAPEQRRTKSSQSPPLSSAADILLPTLARACNPVPDQIMRLLNTATFKLQEFGSNKIPRYAILSHTWKGKEVTFQDIQGAHAAKKVGYAKVENACCVAAADGFEYIWIDTCCIDQTSSAELSEAINSMYHWYQEAVVCYAYLADVPSETINGLTDHISASFPKSRWFTRGWTLQELIAPSTVIFLDEQWQEIGT